jgi:TRAP-type C4-dicarboxylate transport system permease small subunit
VHSGGLAVVYFLIKAGSWVMAAGSAASDYAGAAEIVNRYIYYALLMAGIFSAVMLIARVARLVRQARSRAESSSVGARAKEGD